MPRPEISLIKVGLRDLDMGFSEAQLQDLQEMEQSGALLFNLFNIYNVQLTYITY